MSPDRWRHPSAAQWSQWMWLSLRGLPKEVLFVCVSCEFYVQQPALDQPHARPTQDWVCGSQTVPGRQKAAGSVPRSGQLGASCARLVLAQIIINKNAVMSFIICVSKMCTATSLFRLVHRQGHIFARASILGQSLHMLEVFTIETEQVYLAILVDHDQFIGCAGDG